VTIRDGRVGAEGRHGEDFAVVGRDGTIHLPPEALRMAPPGTLLDVETRPDGSLLLVPVGGSPTGEPPVGKPSAAEAVVDEPSVSETPAGEPTAGSRDADRL
jgi:hypothetical protein